MKNEKPKLDKKWKIYIKLQDAENWLYESPPLPYGAFSIFYNCLKPLSYNKKYLVQLKNETCHDFVEKMFSAPPIQELHFNEQSNIDISEAISDFNATIKTITIDNHDDLILHASYTAVTSSKILWQISIINSERFKGENLSNEKIKLKEAVYSDLKLAQNEFLWGVKNEFAPFIYGALKTDWQDFNLIYDVFENRLISSLIDLSFEEKKPILEDYVRLKQAYVLRLEYLLAYIKEQNDVKKIIIDN